MYKFHYKCIGTKYDSSAKFSFTDTGSLVYEIETDNVYEVFCKKTIYLTLKIILKIQTYLILSIKKWLVNWKMKSKEK